MSNAMNLCMHANCGHDLFYMTGDTTLYRVLSGGGMDPDASDSTAQSIGVLTGEYVLLDLANIDVAATQALYDAHDFDEAKHYGAFSSGFPLV